MRRIRFIGAVLVTTAIMTTGPATAAEILYEGFDAPVDIATDDTGALYVSNWSGGSVERIAPDGTRTEFASGLSAPAGIAIAEDGAIYIATYSGDTILRYKGVGEGEVIAEDLATPTGIAFGNDGRLLIANRAAGEVLAMDPDTGQYEVLADGFSTPVGVVQMPDGSIVVSQYGGRLTRVTSEGNHQELGDSFARPGVGILANGEDAVVAVDYGAGSVRRVTFDGASTIVSSDIDGNPVALGRDNDGNLLVGTWGTGRVYRVRGDATAANAEAGE